MPETDMLAYTLKKFGEPEHAQRVGADEGARYADRLPAALIRFWREHGRGAFERGKFWICDPAPFDPVVDALFHGDPEFDPAEMTAIGYSAFGRLEIWHRTRRAVSVDFLFHQVFNAPSNSWHDKSGYPFSDDFSVGNQLTSFQYGPVQVDNAGHDLLPQAIQQCGALNPGEMFAFIPPIAHGGQYKVANLRRVTAAAHMLAMAEMSNFMLTRLTRPEPPHHPYGRVESVRIIGI